ncbi:MAG TPA: hypothetical protein VFV10_13905 [Gammaproteobacteria bacterium]|nr:hypothetical protein [Gammaproteobacteria bacterium]
MMRRSARQTQGAGGQTLAGARQAAQARARPSVGTGGGAPLRTGVGCEAAHEGLGPAELALLAAMGC